MDPLWGSVGISLKELGGQMLKCLKFCTGIEI